MARRRLPCMSRLCQYLEENNMDTISPQAVVSYLAKRFYMDGVLAQGVTQEKSHIVTTLEIVAGKSWGDNPMITRAIRATQRLMPVHAKYNTMWHAEKIYEYYANIEDKPENRKWLRSKAVVLTRLTLAARSKDTLRIA